ncbi:HAD-IIIC family phosphatase [Streptomyces sp. WAC05374]|uniref:HAD-IIIC family phosphatase n=1 Tax=Streptomyces sp. WAC05374 TaxID=2487420 RepID=UPI000F865D76|nr:HAD-IIIC family phosphatase [Streptomyces sp. WAC05374]RST13569.1 HAD-IIIC family phosphatase [Streptomyces sp. WAC05374]TDF54704.1 HAD-IIIC family phosphatase [Streptomyces sp. WAC05374]TDF56340.1 HAD-IIIC family phosphatase [Streptomyces sp. WAC05374]
MTAAADAPTVKCLVWDLDDTLWDGVVLEGDDPAPFPPALDTLAELDRRGILHAVASRGEHDVAHQHLTAREVADWFCAMEVGWGTKSAAVRRIAEALNIGLDTIAFVDNDPVERAEVASELPMVRCYPAAEVAQLPEYPEFRPEHITAEATGRRRLYQAEWQRRQAEEEYTEGRQAFLDSLDLVMELRPATEEDLARASELTVRTHQLNSTGLTYDIDELRRLSSSPDHQVRLATLRDRFGDYGIIGLAVTALVGRDAVLRLMLMSCRVASRGAGSVLLHHLIQQALAAGRRPVAHFIPTAVNRNLLVTMRFAGYEATGTDEERLVLTVDPERPPRKAPGHIRVIAGAA